MVKLEAQIEVLQELPARIVYPADSQLGSLTMKTGALTDDIVGVIKEKRELLNKLNGGEEISNLKGKLQEQADVIGKLQKEIQELRK